MRKARLILGLALLPMLCWGALAPAAGSSVLELKLWTHQRHMADTLQQLIDRFNRTEGRKKGIRLSLRLLGDGASGVFQAAQIRNEGPDLYSSGFDTGYGDPVQAGAQTWFDEFPGFDAWKAQWPSWYWMEGVTTYRGHVISLPAQVINSRLIYNRDLFRAIGRDPDKPPRSYAELRDIARRITKVSKGRAFGFAYCGADDWPLEWMPSQWAEANGEAAYWDWKKGRWAMQGYTRVFQMLLDLQKDGSLFPGTVILTNESLRAQFAEGRIGMFMGEAWDVGVLNSQFPARCDWGVGPIPTYDGRFHGKPRAMIIPGYWSINGQCRHKLEAWEVVQWFSRYEIRAKLYEAGKCIDPDPVVAAQYVKHRPAMRGFNEFANTLDQDYLATYPNLSGWRPPWENPFTILRFVMQQGGDLTEYMRWLDFTWNKALDTYYSGHPSYKRGWNIYPSFDRTRSRQLGKAQSTPVFKDN